jgi:hypothetical protein
MGFLNAISGILSQYAGGNTPPDADVHQHFEQVSQVAPASTIAQGLAAAFNSGQTPPFAQMAAQLFGNSGGGTRANVLNTLLASAGPAMLSQFLGGNAGSALSSLLGRGQTQVTPEQASAIPPEEVQSLADHVQKHDPSIVDRLSSVYAEHPTLIKSLGAVAMGIALKKVSENMRG